jgi:hypothetical protein
MMPRDEPLFRAQRLQCIRHGGYSGAFRIPPVQNIWFNVFQGFGAIPTRLNRAIIWQTNGLANPENLEVRLTLDGIVYTGALALCASGTVYSVYSLPTIANRLNLGGSATPVEIMLYEGIDALASLYEIRQTSAVGAGAQLYGYMSWGYIDYV